MTSDAERRLVDEVRNGDSASFGLLIDQHVRMVGRIVARLIDGPEDREEVCQDVFVRVHRGIGGYRGDVPLAAWIARIAHNTAINRLKRSRRGRSSSIHDMAIAPALAAPGPDPAELSESNQLRDIVLQELARLPALQRTILTLYHLQEMPVQEIAVVLEIPTGTVKSHLFRSRKVLKDRLLERYATEDLR